ncbi:hypothetical protein AGABI2DRAFT_77291 [Agaricus bisporus var. bisporus H97]|uniref:hypothetical protein n=1 Tax=Agaricus bisporus var. bisporus (strain H97 / ATCC MYA-4626 / FGSC 10389) TaxID=936046 RepID=UPI00029F61EC|nr:hypothetical protein AGABI2DRAFT_77291 [Agaricus bisporus var. bisporus H97]EKV43059.1 hypothetical protein AGABI2DRAFT_77291 [Agaricus bisporus var. bisporus H97]
MHLFFLLFLFSTVAAIHPFSLSRTPRSSHDINPSRPRFKLATPSLVDICASVDLSLLLGIQEVAGLALPNDISTDSDLCLCLQDLDLYLDSDTRLVWLTNLIGQDALLAYLTALIDTSPSRQDCILPAHAHRTCNDQDVCHFDCDTNFVRFGNSCICNPPFSVCNGVCGNFNGCPSSIPQIGRREPENITGIGHAKSGVKSLHVERVTCVDGECFSKTCAVGWIYSKEEDACIRSATMSRRNRRSVARQIGDGTITLDIHVTINMVRLLRAIGELYTHSSFLRKQSDPRARSIMRSCDRLDQLAIDMVGSDTLGSFLDSTYGLLNVAQLLDGLLSSLNSTGLELLQADLGTIVASSTNILSWYHFPGSGVSGSGVSGSGISGSGVPGSSTSGSSSSVDLNTPITITLNRWLGDLGLNGVKTTVRYGGLGGLGTAINGLLDGLGIGPADEGQALPANASFDDALHMQMGALLGYALDVGSSVTPASPAPQVGSGPPAGSAVTGESLDLQTILAPVSRATLGLLLATDLSALLDYVDLIIAASTNARTTLDLYDNFDGMTTQLSLVTKTALDVKSLCSKQLGSDTSLASGRKVAAAKAPGDGSVVIPLDGLLYSLGISGNVTVGGLGRGFSAALNGILNAFNLGATRARRAGGGSAAVNSAIFMDSSLTQLFRAAVEYAIDLEMKTASSPGPVASLLAGSMSSVISSMQAMLGSPTVAGLIGEVDGLLRATRKMNRSLTACHCTSLLVEESTGRFVGAVKEVGRWLDEHARMSREAIL